MGITLFRSKSQPSGALELTGLGHPQGQLYGEAERSEGTSRSVGGRQQLPLRGSGDLVSRL